MRSRPDSSTRWSRRRPGSTPPRPRRAGNKMADRAPNRFACLSSLCLLRDSRILLLLAAQDAASPPPPSRRSLLLPTLALSLFSPISLSLCLLISPCLSVSLPTLSFSCYPSLYTPGRPSLFLCFVSLPLFLSLTLVLSLPICRRIRPLVFADVFSLVSFSLSSPHPSLPGPSCRSLGFYTVLISLPSSLPLPLSPFL